RPQCHGPPKSAVLPPVPSGPPSLRGERRRAGPVRRAPAPYEGAESMCRQRGDAKPPSSAPSGGFVVNGEKLDDLEFAHAAGRRGLDAIARLFIEERAPDWRRRRNETPGGVGVFRHHQLKYQLVA